MRAMSRTVVALMRTSVLAAVLSAVLCGCAPAPLYKPIKGGPVDAGPGSLEAVRRQLEGTWTLTSYEVYQDGKRRRLPASAHLSYDEFGNLTLDGELRQPDATAPQRPLLLNYSGRAVIDVANRELRLLDVEATGDALSPALEEQTSPTNVRRYDIRGSVLTLTIVDASGRPTAAAAWTKAP
jgi:hypothetical protein